MSRAENGMLYIRTKNLQKHDGRKTRRNNAGRRTPGCLHFLACLLVFLLVEIYEVCDVYAYPRMQDPGSEIVVVIDAGHGGSNEGTDSSDVLEKYRTLVTAQAMYDELSKYDGVKVYMTRTEDVDMTLKSRAQYASSVGADLLVSLHYNASEDHHVFGAEAWVPSTLPLFNYADQFAEVWLSEMSGLGIHLRGVKTRIKEDGSEYYGLIREGKTLGIPVVLLEHCYVDSETDAQFCDSEEKEQRLGRADATAVAKYFGLKSGALGVDYSNVELTVVSVQDVGVIPLSLSTPPEKCTLELLEKNEDTGEVTFKITAADSDELLEYYDFSIDGGQTWQGISVWPGYDIRTIENRSEAIFHVTLPRDRDSQVRARVYNYYDQRTRSGSLRIHFKYQDEMAEAARAWDEEHDDTLSPDDGNTDAEAAAYDRQETADGYAEDSTVSGGADEGETGEYDESGNAAETGTDTETASEADGDAAMEDGLAQDEGGHAPAEGPGNLQDGGLAAPQSAAGTAQDDYNADLAGGIFAIVAVVLLGVIVSVAVRFIKPHGKRGK